MTIVEYVARTVLMARRTEDRRAVPGLSPRRPIHAHSSG